MLNSAPHSSSLLSGSSQSGNTKNNIFPLLVGLQLGSWSALFGALWDNFISIDADFDSEYNRKIFILIAAMVDALDANY
jgi:hypothetical protein